jgi:subtilisin family serine protease
MKFLALSFLLVSMSLQAATIAVIDSGLDVNHQDLKSNIWVNANEVADGRDTDGNSYPDDIYGWNFAEQNNKIIDIKITFIIDTSNIKLRTSTGSNCHYS